MFDEQRFGQFFRAKREATAILKHETPRRRRLSFDEGVALQAVSHLLIEGEENFIYPGQVAHFVEQYYSKEDNDEDERQEDRTMYTVLNRFAQLGLFTVRTETHEEAIGHHGKPRHIFTPTQLGNRLLILFQRES